VGALFDWQPERTLFEDDDLVVVDKPWGLATHAPEPGRHDDIVSWLSSSRRAAKRSDYLGIHQRLDRETSGVLLFAARKPANAALAKQFEGRSVEKSYLAVIEGATRGKTFRLEHYVSPGDGGVVRARGASGRPGPREQLAKATAEILERRGRRALVRVVPETGRTHQVRVQLAAAGMPIVGDLTYGGPPHLRVMLHAERLGLRHPATNAPISFRADTPAWFALALAATKVERPTTDAELDLLLREAGGRRYGVIADGETNALRWIHSDGDGMPGVTVDLYDEHAVLSIYDELEREEVSRIANALVRVGARGVYVKYRPKHASRIVDSRTDDVAPKEPLAGEPAPDSFEVKESGLPFEVHLGDGLSTGIFLDQRETRRRVRDLAGGRSVLNLFGYTGAFSVAASSGGARSTLDVDISRGTLAWAERNLARVGADPSVHTTAEADTFDFLIRAAKKGERWDLVILDPPSFSTTKKSTWSAESGYDELAALALSVVTPGGILLACTNHRRIPMGKLRKMLHAAAKSAAREVLQMKNLAPPSDYPPTPGFEPHLKCVLVTLR